MDRRANLMWQGIDQRRFPRARCQCVVNLRQPVKGAGAFRAVTENIGLGGICVLLEQGLEIFSPVELELTLEDGKPPIKAQGTIVWVVRRREVKKGPSFDTGVEFAGLLPEDKARLEALMDKLSPD
ncbi:MAG: PilZ domain-containing protein [Candidatus Omnitrophica bacterium]|nr:PilZ domain-containing protein [Candidatus Omnitrophota bacterium]